jgi:hypothetical protein
MSVIVDALWDLQQRFKAWGVKGWQTAAAEWLGLNQPASYNTIVKGGQKGVTFATLLQIRRRLPATVLRALEFPVPEGVVDEVPEPPAQLTSTELEAAVNFLGDVTEEAIEAARLSLAQDGDRERGDWLDFLRAQRGNGSVARPDGKRPKPRTA